MFTLGYQLVLESRRSVRVLDRGHLAGDLVGVKEDNTNRPVRLLDLSRLANQSAPGQLPPHQAFAGRPLPGQKRLQLRHPVQNLLKVNQVSQTSGRQVFHILKIDATLKTLRASERVQFHRDEMQRAWNDETETVPDVAAATFALDCGEGLCVGQHQIHWKRSGCFFTKKAQKKSPLF